jgi:hypothetical protein
MRLSLSILGIIGAIGKMKGIIQMRKPKDPKTAAKTKAAEPAPEDIGGATSSEGTPEAEPEITPKSAAETGSAAKDTPQAPGQAADEFAQAEPPQDDLPHGEPAHEEPHPEEHPEEHHPEEHQEEHGHRSLAATALMILAGVIVVASLTLWAAPKLAPHLPASMAQYLMPGQIDTQNRLAALDAAVAAEAAKSDATSAALNAEIAALGTRLDAAAESSQTDAAIAAAQSAADAAAGAADDAAEAAAAGAARLDTIEMELASLRDEFSAVSTALANAGSGDGPASPEIAAAVAALGARLDGLAASVEDSTAVEALEARIAALADRLGAVESSAADARDAQSETLGEVSTALRQARLQAAVDLLASRLTGGLPYAAKLGEIAGLTDAEPPEPLAAGAETGLATAAVLEASFARHAQAAVAAEVQVSTGEGTGLQALGWLRAQVAGRPTSEQEGDSVGAITSRIAARVGEGNLAEALAEAETLPEHSQAGLGGWLDQLRARVAAETALTDWGDQIGASG